MFLKLFVPVFAFACFIVAPVCSQDKTDPIEAEVKANLKDLTKPFVLFVQVKVKADSATKFEAAFAIARTATRKEKGNKAYSLNRSTKNPLEYVVYERWENFAALQKHIQMPHFKALIAEIGGHIDGPPSVKVFLPTRE